MKKHLIWNIPSSQTLFLLFNFVFINSYHTNFHSNILRGKMACLAPECFATGGITEKFDAFSFGMFLLQVLTRRAKMVLLWSWYWVSFLTRSCLWSYRQSTNDWDCTTCSNFERRDIEEQQLQAIAKLALSCMSEEAEDRPTMTDVAREFRSISLLVVS